MLKRIASLAIGLFLVQLFASAALAQSPNPDPRVEELLRRLQQLTAPQPQGSRGQRAVFSTHIKAVFNIVEKQSTACFRNAQIFWSILNLNNEFFSGTSIKELTCAQGKCTGTVDAYPKVPDTDANAKINVSCSVLANCKRVYTNDERKTVNSESQTLSFAANPAQVDQGGTSTTKCNSQISDIRLKRDIAEVGRLANGLPLYRYRYPWSDIEYVGVMAQEVAAVMPEAVLRGTDGYLRVDYARLGTRLMTFDTWSARRALMARAQ